MNLKKQMMKRDDRSKGSQTHGKNIYQICKPCHIIITK